MLSRPPCWRYSVALGAPVDRPNTNSSSSESARAPATRRTVGSDTAGVAATGVLDRVLAGVVAGVLAGVLAGVGRCERSRGGRLGAVSAAVSRVPRKDVLAGARLDGVSVAMAVRGGGRALCTVDISRDAGWVASLVEGTERDRRFDASK